jgi:tRNA A37 methylthiotransferase MiaB
MPDQVKKTVKEARAAAVAACAFQMEKAYLESLSGKILDVLFETEHDAFSWGHAKNNALVSVSGNILRNSEKSVRITRVYKDIYWGFIRMKHLFISTPVP